MFDSHRSIIKGTLLSRAICFLCCISASIGELSLNSHTLHFPRMRYKRCKFGCNRSIIIRWKCSLIVL
jgi:hypothetical protein